MHSGCERSGDIDSGQIADIRNVISSGIQSSSCCQKYLWIGLADSNLGRVDNDLEITQ